MALTGGRARWVGVAVNIVLAVGAGWALAHVASQLSDGSLRPLELDMGQAGALAALAFCTATAVAIRGLRWRTLIAHRMALGASQAIGVFAWCFVLQLVLPLRAGELSRSAWAALRGGPALAMLGVVGLERAQDLTVVAFLAATVLLGAPEHWPWVLGVAGLAAAFYAALWLLAPPLVRLLAARSRESGPGAPVALAARTIRLLASVASGFEALGFARAHLSSVMLTLAIWTVTVLGYWLAVEAFFPGTGLLAAAAVVGAINLASILPVTPGNVVMYEGAFIAVLGVNGADLVQALVAAILTHLAALVGVVALGAYGRIRHGGI